MKFLELVTIVFLVTSCSNMQKLQNEKGNEVNIYCNCFGYDLVQKSLNDSTVVVNVKGGCNIITNVKVDQLIKSDKLFKVIRNQEQIQRIRRVVRGAESDLKKYIDIDNRLGLVLDNDTLVFMDRHTLVKNNRSVLKYDFNVLDSLEYTIGETIICN